MGQNSSILTELQKRFLELVIKEKTLVKNYYWTGGTVLSEFYLHHRDSEDIDLFTEKEEVQIRPINVFVKKAAISLKAKNYTYAQFLGLHTFTFEFSKKLTLKVDFNYYPFPPLDKGGNYKGLYYDSVIDIAVNKIQTIATGPRSRDFIDLYVIHKTYKFETIDLMKKARQKFDYFTDPLQLAGKFLLVKEVSDLPKMRIQIKDSEWREFFINEAKKLKKYSLKN